MNHMAPPNDQMPVDSPVKTPMVVSRSHAAGYVSTSALSEKEARILSALSDAGHCLSLGQLRARTGILREDLKPILEGLRAKGLAARLNTVVESYSCRFPGIRVDDV
jgi:hypothetical protein